MANIRDLIFYIPFSYTLSTRVKTVSSCIRLFTKYVFPVAVIAFCRNGFTIDLLLLGIGFFFVYNLYEIGYIQNDTETIKREVNPTLRLSEPALAFYGRHRFSIYSCRFIIAFLLSYLIFRLDGHWQPLAFGFLLVPSYLLYNAVRNKYSYWIYMWLMMVRYICLAWICCASLSLTDMLYITLMHPMPTMIARFSINRFGYYSRFVHKYFIDDMKHLNLFRVKYFMGLFILCFLLYWVIGLEWFYVAISSYYLLIALMANGKKVKCS